jgi:hypothetical protein
LAKVVAVLERISVVRNDSLRDHSQPLLTDIAFPKKSRFFEPQIRSMRDLVKTVEMKQETTEIAKNS